MSEIKESEVTLNPEFETLQSSENFINELVQDDLLQLYKDLESFEIDPHESIPPPEIAWVSCEGDKEIILGSLGNFSMVIGKAKSRKSFFISLIASVLSSNMVFFDRFKGCLPKHKDKVLYFDTEQSKYHLQLSLKRVCSQINNPQPQNIKVYGLRSKSPQERLNMVEAAIYKTPNLGFVIIDGVKDLITSINDEEQATMIATKLLKWTEEVGIHIILVLHQNKSDNNARGHLGTELLNKCETVLSVTKDSDNKEISIVEAEQCRNIEPEPFAFEIDSNGLPSILDEFEFQSSKRGSKIDITSINSKAMLSILENAFSENSELNYSKLKELLKVAYFNQFKTKYGAGDNKIKELISHLKLKGWICQAKPKSPYILNKDQINDDLSMV